MSRVRVYMACSLDGFIAGPNDDLDWLHADRKAPGDLPAHPDALRFEPFLAELGAMLMGRTTYDVVRKMGFWPYGSLPVLVATRRPIENAPSTVRAVSGPVETLIEEARAVAEGRDVYLDGGDLVRQALNAGCVDEITATIVPVLLGSGTRLFDGLVASTNLQFVGNHAYEGGMVQLRARVVR
ncbi:MAG: dihydrofolate reductase family protein [Polyangiales bacterium]|nr:dihydrofolate reductase [Myxococcales bacterium]